MHCELSKPRVNLLILAFFVRFLLLFIAQNLNDFIFSHGTGSDLDVFVSNSLIVLLHALFNLTLVAGVTVIAIHNLIALAIVIILESLFFRHVF